MAAGVLIVPGVRRVTNEDQTIRIPRASTPKCSQNVRTGVDRATVLALLGFCLIADGGALFLCGMMTR